MRYMLEAWKQARSLQDERLPRWRAEFAWPHYAKARDYHTFSARKHLP
jgi:hypothetical protein